MTKKLSTIDRFRALGVFNPFEFASRFGTKGVDDFIITYHTYESRMLDGHKATVWAPGRVIDPEAHFLDRGAKAFHGNRAEAVPKAMAWAKAELKLADWAPCPVDRSSWVPKAVRERGLAWLKERERTRLCPVCGDKITVTGRTKDGRMIGSCGDAFAPDPARDRKPTGARR